MHDRWTEFTDYLTDGSLEIDNNGAENQIRPFALGLKNRLMAWSPRGSHACALSYSPIATAVANGWSPSTVYSIYLKTSVFVKLTMTTPSYCLSILSQKSTKLRNP